MHKRKGSSKTFTNVQNFQNIKIYIALKCAPLTGDGGKNMDYSYNTDAELSGEMVAYGAFGGCGGLSEYEIDEKDREAAEEEEAEYWAELYEAEMEAKRGEGYEGLHNGNC